MITLAKLKLIFPNDRVSLNYCYYPEEKKTRCVLHVGDKILLVFQSEGELEEFVEKWFQHKIYGVPAPVKISEAPLYVKDITGRNSD